MPFAIIECICFWKDLFAFRHLMLPLSQKPNHIYYLNIYNIYTNIFLKIKHIYTCLDLEG